jgi:hypothetical protein
MAKAPTRFKSQDDLDGDETLAVVQARRRGDDVPKFETRQYRQHRIDILREGGLDDEADELEQQDGDGRPLEEMSPGEHLDRILGQH